MNKPWDNFVYIITFIAAAIWVVLLSGVGIAALVRLWEMGW